MPWNFYNSSGELQIQDGGVSASAAVFTGNADLGSNLLVGNAGSTGIAISANGEVTMAAQPCVLAHNSGTDSNVTGSGTTYTLDLDTEIFDQNADFASDTFTAPVTGRYLVLAQADYEGMAADPTTQNNFKIITSNRTYDQIAETVESNDNNSVRTQAIVDMDAADTLTITIAISGQASDLIDLRAGTTSTRLSVCLLA